MNLLGNISLMETVISKNDFSAYLTGDELIERADKYIMTRATLLKKQLRENEMNVVVAQNSKKLTHA
jgi:hypothetical protein